MPRLEELDFSTVAEKPKYSDLDFSAPEQPDVPGPLGDIFFVPKEPKGVFAFDKQLDDLFSGEVELEDLLPMDARYNFGKIVGMTSKPEETKDKIASSLYYSVELGRPPKQMFNVIDTLNKVALDEKSPSTAWKRIKQRYATGKSQVQAMDLGYDILTKTWADWDEYDKQIKNLKKLEVPEDIRKEFRGFWEKVFGASAEQIPILLESIKAAPIPAIGGGFIGGTIAGLASVFLVPTVGEEPFAIGAGFATGIKAGAALAAANRIRQLEAGGQFLELAQTKDEYGNRVDPKIAVVASHAVGAINGGIEILEWKVLLGAFGIGEGLFRGAVDNVTKRIAAQGTLKNIVAKAIMKYGIALTAETLQEVEQETTNVVFGELAKELNNLRKGTDFKPITAEDLKERYWEVTAESLRAFGVILAPGVGISGAIETVVAKSKEKAVKPTEAPKVEVPVPIKKPPEAPLEAVVAPPVAKAPAEGVEVAEKVEFQKRDILTKSGEKAGVIRYAKDGNVLRISTIRIEKEFRRQGLATKIIEEIVQKEQVDTIAPLTGGWTKEGLAFVKAFVKQHPNIKLAEVPAEVAKPPPAVEEKIAPIIEPEIGVKKPKVAEEVPAKRVISKETYEAAKKRLTDRDVLRMGVDPQGFVDFATIGAYHIETGLRTFGAWSKKMVEEFGEKITPHLKRIWKDSQKQVKLGPEADLKSLIKQIKTIQTQKGLTDKQYKEIKRKVTASGQAVSAARMPLEELQALLEKMKRARPRRIEGKRVITKKTEGNIQKLKENLKKKLALTDEAFAEILQREIHGKEPRYIDAKNFITETQGRDIIRRMHDTGEVLRVTQPREQAVAKNDEIKRQVSKLKEKVAKEKKRDPYRIESMRYYAQQSERLTGAPIFPMYKDLIDTNNEMHRTRHARMAALEKAAPKFREIAADEKALKRVSDYIASQSTLKEKPPVPKDITKSEIKLAEEIQKIFDEYKLTARVNKFFNWYYYGEEIAEYEQFKKEIDKARDIYDSQGKEGLIEYLKTQTWGVIKSGYEPLEVVLFKVKPYKTGPKAVGKGHVKVRTDIEYHEQERNILQRLNAYMKQMDMLYNLSPKINAFVRLFDDNMNKFSNPRAVKQSVESFFTRLKRYNMEGSWIGDLMARFYAQASQIIIMAQPVLAFRNLFQNAAFEHDKTILFDPRNEPLTPEDTEYMETHVYQMRGMMEEFFMINEKAFLGTRKLMEVLRKIKIYAWSDVKNRGWDFWAKINQVRRAQKAETIEEMMKQSKFEDITEEEQIMALSILAYEGKDAMARYVSRIHVDDIHFLYERAQRSPAEMDPLGRVFGNLLLFPRAYIEKLAHAEATLQNPKSTQQQRYRAGKIIVSVIGGGYLAGLVFMAITGRKRNPYNPLEIIQLRIGGLYLGAMMDINEVGLLTLRAIVGDKTAMYALTSKLPDMADDFIPFYDWTFRIIEASTDTKNIDRQALREIYGAIDKEYRTRDSSYKMKRSFIKKLQYVFAGPSVDIEEKKKGTKVKIRP